MQSLHELYELLALPFLASVVLVGIHCQFGLQVLKRNVVFVDLALAQCAALGATVAFMQGHLPQSATAFGWSLGFAWSGALLLSLVRFAPKHIPHEALVGVVYVASASAALLLLEQAPQGAEHLKQIMVGSVLTLGADELLKATPVYLLIGMLLWLATRRKWLEGKGVAGWVADFGFYAMFGLIVTSSVAMVGVLLVFSFLIVPAILGLLFAVTHGRQIVMGWTGGAIAAALGLVASFALNTSTGATMVCAFALILVVSLLARSLADFKLQWTKALVFLARTGLALVIASAVWLAVHPRAEQPLLNAAEAFFPSVRWAYFNAQETAIYEDAQAYAARYAGESLRLGNIERSGRWQNASVDDDAVKRIASFQQSYNEMTKGEQYVMKEIRSRARERHRLSVALAAAGMLALLTVWIGGFQRMRFPFQMPRSRFN